MTRSMAVTDRALQAAMWCGRLTVAAWGLWLVLALVGASLTEAVVLLPAVLALLCLAVGGVGVLVEGRRTR